MITDQFSVPPRLKSTGMLLLGLGIIALLGGMYTFLFSSGHTEHDVARFWVVLLQNSVFLHIGSHEQAQQCFADLTNILHPKQDNLRFYSLPNHTLIHTLGKTALPAGVILGGFHL